jgi:hypothetical protein
VCQNCAKKINWGYFDTFGILATKMTLRIHIFVTTKMYTKLASIEINDEILSKVVRIRKNSGTKLVHKL